MAQWHKARSSPLKMEWQGQKFTRTPDLRFRVGEDRGEPFLRNETIWVTSNGGEDLGVMSCRLPPKDGAS